MGTRGAYATTVGPVAASPRGPARPHVGRSAELERLLTAVTAPDGRGAILAGPAGVGKSHLLDRALDQLLDDGWSPVRAHGDPARRQPFDAFGDMLPPLAGDPHRWAHVLRTGVDHLVACAGPGRPVLVADDLHAFDPASAALLQQAVADGRLRLLATMRSGVSAPDAVTALWKEDVVERVELRPLSLDEATELAEALVGGPVDDATRQRLWTWTEGNALLVTEIVEQARLAGAWRQRAGMWGLDRVPTHSPRLAGLLDDRLSRCSADVVDLVDAVALAGRLPVLVADALVGRGAVATAERLRLVRVWPEQGWAGITLDHPLYAELRRGATPAERRSALQHRLLDVVEALERPRSGAAPERGPGPHPGPGEDVDASRGAEMRVVSAADRGAAGTVGTAGTASPSGNGSVGPSIGAADQALVAQWYLETGRVGPRTADILLAAAERAWGGNDPASAADLARRAWQLRPDDRAGHLLVSALARIGATDDLEEVAPVVTETAASDRVRAQAVLARALAQFMFANRPERGRAVLAEGTAHIADAGWRDVLTAEGASYRLMGGDVPGAEALARPLLESPNVRAAAEAAAVVGPALALQGRIAEAVAVADRGIDLAISLPDDYLDTGQYLFHKLVALVDDGQVMLAEELVVAALDDLPPQADAFTRAFMTLSLGRILALRGRHASATRWFREAAAGYRSVRRLGFEAWAFAGLAGSLAHLGDVEGAEAAAARGLGRDDHPIRVGTAEMQRSTAWVHVARGDLDAAADALDAAAGRGLAASEVVHAGHALHDLLRIGRADRVRDRLDRLAQRTDSTVLGVYADHAAAVRGRDRAALEHVAERFESLGCDLAAAEVWSEVARCDGASQDRRAAAAGRRATALAARCEGARSPLLPEMPAHALSERELQIARLAARGENRRAIAQSLVISRRTVDSHLQRVYRKLGVTSRQALAEALTESGQI